MITNRHWELVEGKLVAAHDPWGPEDGAKPVDFPILHSKHDVDGWEIYANAVETEWLLIYGISDCVTVKITSVLDLIDLEHKLLMSGIAKLLLVDGEFLSASGVVAWVESELPNARLQLRAEAVARQKREAR